MDIRQVGSSLRFWASLPGFGESGLEGLCAHAHMHACVCLCMCVCLCVCVAYMWRTADNLGVTPQVLSTLFFRQNLFLDWSSLSRLECLASELEEFACQPPPAPVLRLQVCATSLSCLYTGPMDQTLLS